MNQRFFVFLVLVSFVVLSSACGAGPYAPGGVVNIDAVQDGDPVQTEVVGRKDLNSPCYNAYLPVKSWLVSHCGILSSRAEAKAAGVVDVCLQSKGCQSYQCKVGREVLHVDQDGKAWTDGMLSCWNSGIEKTTTP